MRQTLPALLIALPVLLAVECDDGRLIDATFEVTNTSDDYVQIWVRPDIVGPDQTYDPGETRTLTRAVYDISEHTWGIGMGIDSVPLRTSTCSAAFSPSVVALTFTVTWDGTDLTCTADVDDPGASADTNDTTDTPVDTDTDPA
ncbi:MAG: hypothetical protein H6733_06845 [Alphaproteobacteria bacterium]|nr:hypothetical protein [Alphaproteobacteria bacterium]